MCVFTIRKWRTLELILHFGTAIFRIKSTLYSFLCSAIIKLHQLFLFFPFLQIMKVYEKRKERNGELELKESQQPEQVKPEVRAGYMQLSWIAREMNNKMFKCFSYLSEGHEITLFSSCFACYVFKCWMTTCSSFVGLWMCFASTPQCIALSSTPGSAGIKAPSKNVLALLLLDLYFASLFCNEASVQLKKKIESWSVILVSKSPSRCNPRIWKIMCKIPVRRT